MADYLGALNTGGARARCFGLALAICMGRNLPIGAGSMCWQEKRLSLGAACWCAACCMHTIAPGL